MSYFLKTLGVAALLGGAVACGSSANSDSVKEAQQANEAKIDSTTTASTPGASKGDKEYDSEFMTKAAAGGLLEVQLGQEVAQRATTPEAKKFAQQMVTDHTKGNAEMKALAAKKHLILPSSLGEDQQKAYNKVVAGKGAQLDQQYVQAMIDDHQEDIKDYQEAAAKATDPELKALAAKTLPMLQMHLQMVTKIQPVVAAQK